MISFEEIRDVIAEELGIEPDKIQPETRLDALDLDSLEFIELMLKLGDVPEESYKKLNTVQDIVRAIG